MKLANKINLRFLALLLIVFSVAGGVLYFVLGYVVDKNIDEILENRAGKVIQSLSNDPDAGLIRISSDQSIRIDTVMPQPETKVFSDTTVNDAYEREFIQYRKLILITDINEKYYRVQIILSRLETEDMAELIFYFMITLFAIIVLLLLLLNNKLSRSVWHPFYSTLENLQKFKPGGANQVSFTESGIYEFNQLNHTLNEMIRKIEKDFSNLKEFTENASHEIQTPLAILKTNLENILQDRSLSNEHRKQIQVAYRSASRLSKLNQALLLLSNIENHQYFEETEINLCNLVNERTKDIQDLLSVKKIKLTLNLSIPVKVHINPQLADILINNLLNNAIAHNIDAGDIILSSSKDQLLFSNSGKPLVFEQERIFLRFVKDPRKNESTGLGLAIANEICKNYNIGLRYFYDNEMHNFCLALEGR